jgi:aminotransferase
MLLNYFMIHVFGANTGKEELDSITSSIKNNWMGCGPKVEQFEKLFTERLERPFVAVNNGSNALHLAVKLLNLPKGSEIILPSFTFIACANAILLEGHHPVFADVELDGNISIRTLEQVLTPKTKAIMTVHYAGKPACVESFGLPLIEDVAHAVDSKIGTRYCGAFGTVAAFSFDPIKNLATPDMGGVVCDDLDKAKALRHCGLKGSGFDKSGGSKWWVDSFEDVFPKYMPNDVSASVALVQLEKLKENQAKRKRIWDIYQSAFGKLNWLETPCESLPYEQHSYFTYLIRVKAYRDKFAVYLKENGVYTTLRFHPIHMTFNIYNNLPNTELLAETGLNLPLHPRMSDSEISMVVDLVCKAF